MIMLISQILSIFHFLSQHDHESAPLLPDNPESGLYSTLVLYIKLYEVTFRMRLGVDQLIIWGGVVWIFPAT